MGGDGGQASEGRQRFRVVRRVEEGRVVRLERKESKSFNQPDVSAEQDGSREPTCGVKSTALPIIVQSPFQLTVSFRMRSLSFARSRSRSCRRASRRVSASGPVGEKWRRPSLSNHQSRLSSSAEKTMASSTVGGSPHSRMGTSGIHEKADRAGGGWRSGM